MADLGKKHECSECGAKFYDLGKADPVCPRCGNLVSSGDDEPAAKSRRKRKTPPAPAKPRVEAGAEFSDGDSSESFDDVDDSAEIEDDEEIDTEGLEDLDDDEDDEEEEEDDD